MTVCLGAYSRANFDGSVSVVQIWIYPNANASLGDRMRERLEAAR
jgi:hypothetical protein